MEALAPALSPELPPAAATSFAYSLPTEGRIELAVHDTKGRRVRTLLAGDADATAGSIAWDRRDDAGRLAPAGVYFVRLTFAGSEIAAAERRVVLVN